MHRRPSHSLRFLAGALWGAPFLLIAVAMQSMARVACGEPACPSVPVSALLPQFALFAGGVLYSAYRWYRDHVKGDLARDDAPSQ